MAADVRSTDEIADAMANAESDDDAVRAAADAANDALLDAAARDYEAELIRELGPKPTHRPDDSGYGTRWPLRFAVPRP